MHNLPSSQKCPSCCLTSPMDLAVQAVAANQCRLRRSILWTYVLDCCQRSLSLARSDWDQKYNVYCYHPRAQRIICLIWTFIATRVRQRTSVCVVQVCILPEENWGLACALCTFAAERFVQSFKRVMKASERLDKLFQQCLMSFLFTYRKTPHATTNAAPCTLIIFKQASLNTSQFATSKCRRDCGWEASRPESTAWLLIMVKRAARRTEESWYGTFGLVIDGFLLRW